MDTPPVYSFSVLLDWLGIAGGLWFLSLGKTPMMVLGPTGPGGPGVLLGASVFQPWVQLSPDLQQQDQTPELGFALCLAPS